MELATNDLAQALAHATLTGLYYYPIKSCAGRPAQQVEVGPRGILYDRELMLVEAASGEFLTQRELPRMALLRPNIAGGRLQVEAPAMPDFEMDLPDDGPPLMVTVWKDRCPAVDLGQAAAGWFSRFLGVECRLVRLSPGFTRPVSPDYALDRRDQVGFADGFPFLLISQESLDELNRRLAAPLPMNRFRPNLVIAGSGLPFVEDRLRRVAVGDISFGVVKPCARCAITTTDQQTGHRGKEPLRTLATFRRNPDGQVMFGQNLIHEKTGLLRTGDPVRLIEGKPLTTVR